VVGLLGHNGPASRPHQDPLRRLQARFGFDPHRWQRGFDRNPRDAKAYGIETIYQTLALADNVDAASNLYLGRELRTAGALSTMSRWRPGPQGDGRLNPNFRRFKEPVMKLSAASANRWRSPGPSTSTPHPHHGRAHRGVGPPGDGPGRRTHQAAEADGIEFS